MLLSRDKVTNDPDETRDQILSFLEKKYGKEFVPMSIEMDRWPYHYDDLVAYPKGGDRKKEYFEAYRERKNGKYVYSDCYFSVLIHDEYEEKISEIAKEFFPQNKVVVNGVSDSFPNELNSKSTLQDALDMKAYAPSVNVRVAPTLSNIDEFNEKVDLFIKKLVDNKMRGAMNVEYFKNNNLDVNEVTSTMYYKDRQFYIDSNYNIK